jgi:aminomethyltransferase
LDKGDFIGRDVLVAQKAKGIERRLVGLVLKERGFPRHGYPIVSNDTDVGEVTSGIVSPSLGIGVAMGYVPPDLAAAGTEVGVRIRKAVIPAVVQRPPFYTQGSVRR